MTRTPPPADAATIRRYLLGEASEEEADGVEAGYFALEERLDAVSETEQELIDDFLFDRLDPETQARFTGHYLSTAGHRLRVAISRGLRGRIRSSGPPMPFVPLAAAAAFLLVSLLGVAWYLHSRPTVERASFEPAARKGVAARGTTRSVVSIFLPAVQVRGEGETPTVRVGEETQDVELRLELGDPETRGPLEVRLRGVEGEEIWRGPAMIGAGESGARVNEETPSGLREGSASHRGEGPAPGVEGGSAGRADGSTASAVRGGSGPGPGGPTSAGPGARPAATMAYATARISAASLGAGDYIATLFGNDGSELQRGFFRVVRPVVRQKGNR